MGMRTAAILSQMKGRLKLSDVERITSLIKKAGLPIKIPEDIKENDLVKAMERDKKNKSGTIRFALLDGIGTCEIVSDINLEDIRSALKRSRNDG